MILQGFQREFENVFFTSGGGGVRRKMSTAKLAEICGVSQGTVDRALNNRGGIKPETRDRILRIAKEYGYRPNIQSFNRATGKSGVIGIVIQETHNSANSDLLMRFSKYCHENNYSMVVMFSYSNRDEEKRCVESLYCMQVDGILLCPINDDEEYVNWLLSLKIPIVTIYNKLKSIPFVGIDDVKVFEHIVDYVCSKGYKKLLYLGGNYRRLTGGIDRKEGFKIGAEKHGVEYEFVNEEEAKSRLYEKSKTALICEADVYALSLVGIAKKAKAGIIGVDDSAIIEKAGIKLDSVVYDMSDMIKTAANYIMGKNKMDEKTEHYVEYRIVERGSV